MSVLEKDIELAKQKDPQAFERIYNETIKTAYYIAKKFLGNDEAVEDVLQEAYINVFEKIHTYQSGNFQGWVDVIVANGCRNYLVKVKKDPRMFSDIETEDNPIFEMEDSREEFKPDVQTDYEETKRLVLEMIDKLPTDQRMSVVLFYYEQMSVKEIAKVCECSENTIKSRLNYARKSIKEEVEKLEKKGTKLYCLPLLPFLLWLFKEDAKACQIPATISSGNVMAKTILSNTGATKTVAGAVTQKAGLSLMTKAAIGIVATAVVAGGITVGVLLHNNNNNNNNNSTVDNEPISVVDENKSDDKNETTSEDFVPKAITLNDKEKKDISSVINALTGEFQYYTDEAKNTPIVFSEMNYPATTEAIFVIKNLLSNPDLISQYCSNVNGTVYTMTEESYSELIMNMTGAQAKELEINSSNPYGWVNRMNGMYVFDTSQLEPGLPDANFFTVKELSATQISEDTVLFHGVINGTIQIMNSYRDDDLLKSKYPEYNDIDLNFCVTAKIDETSKLCGYDFIGAHCQEEKYDNILNYVSVKSEVQESEMPQYVTDFLTQYVPTQTEELSFYRVVETATICDDPETKYVYGKVDGMPMIIVQDKYSYGSEIMPMIHFFTYDETTEKMQKTTLTTNGNTTQIGDCQIYNYENGFAIQVAQSNDAYGDAYKIYKDADNQICLTPIWLTSAGVNEFTSLVVGNGYYNENGEQIDVDPSSIMSQFTHIDWKKK